MIRPHPTSRKGCNFCAGKAGRFAYIRQCKSWEWHGAGRSKPVRHRPDPSIRWELPAHLAKYPVSGASREDVLRWQSGFGLHRRDQEIQHLQTELASRDAELVRVDSLLHKSSEDLALRNQEVARHKEEITEREESLGDLAAEFHRISAVLAAREMELKSESATAARLAEQIREQAAQIQERCFPGRKSQRSVGRS